MSDHAANIEVKRGTERDFGIVFAVVFAIIGCFPLMSGGDVRWWSLGISCVMLLLAIAAPSVLRLPNLLWFKFGVLLGAFIAPIVMGLVYFLTIFPMGLIARLAGKDILKTKINKSATSYWIERDTPMQSMKNQF